MINDIFENNVKNINLFHDIYNYKKNSYLNQGISNIHFTLYQNSDFYIPLEIIFKLLNSTLFMPLIKLNLSRKQENIFRLYCSETAKNGKKIPDVSKSEIIKFNKMTANSNRVSCLIKKDSINIVLEINNKGDIIIQCFNKKILNLLEITEIIKKHVNPVIEIIHNYLKQSGYFIKLFDSFYDENVEILDLDYTCYMEISKTISIKKIIGCVSSIFNVEKSLLKNGIVMRYKRVSNFNEMDSIQAFIAESYNKNIIDNELIELLVENYQLTQENAIVKIAEFANNVQLMQDVNKRKRIKLKNNPGFLTTINQDDYKSNITIKVSNINNIRYLEIIPIYIDALITITQDIPEPFKENISKQCTSKQEKKNKEVKEIIAPSEKNYLDNEPISIVAQDLVFGQSAENTKEESRNILDLLNDSDSDDDINEEDEEINSVGGKNSDDSDEEVEISITPPSSNDESTKSTDEIEVELDNDGEDESTKSSIEVELDNDGEDESTKSTNEIEVELDNDGEDESTKSTDEIEVELDNDGEDESTKSSIEVELDNDGQDESTKSSIEDSKTEEVSKTEEDSKTEEVSKPEEKKKKLKLVKESELNDITGMSLSFPNPFFKKLKEKDPDLFLSTQDGKYNAYSRGCQWNKRRQPVILTDSEKERIDKDHPGSYDKALKYGSSPDKQFWYICPRYWDLKNETSLTEEDVKSGKYGDVIDINSKNVPSDKFIFEFNDGKEHIDKTTKKYVNYNPGFLKENAHPNYCVPCCFQNMGWT